MTKATNYSVVTDYRLGSKHMTWESGRSSCLRTLLSPLLLLAVLVGLFAMHGLGSHDDHHSDSHLPWAVAVTLEDTASPAVESGHSHAVHGIDLDEVGSGAATLAPIDSKPASEDGSEPGEGLTILAPALGLLFGLAFAFAGRRPIAVFSRMRRPNVLIGRLLEPPCLYRLSILRC